MRDTEDATSLTPPTPRLFQFNVEPHNLKGQNWEKQHYISMYRDIFYGRHMALRQLWRSLKIDSV